MASINYAAREINVKIVYYGPGLSGKTTNLQIIHRKVPPEYKSDMVSLATETDRTLFFDFLPLDLGKIKGFATKFQLYTVPGQVYYNATRKLVLRGVDGIVFVADSAQDKIDENIESFQNLEENLAEYGYKRENIPIIMQFNKRDLPNAMPVEELQKYINKYNLQWTEAIANKGVGVFDSLKLIGKIVIDYLNKKYSRGSRPAPSGAQQRKAVPPPPRYQGQSAPAPQVQPRPASNYNQLGQPPQQPPFQGGQNFQPRGAAGFPPQQPPMRGPMQPSQNMYPPGQPQAHQGMMHPPGRTQQPQAPAPAAPPRAAPPRRPTAPSHPDEFETFEPQARQQQGAPQEDYYSYGSISLEPIDKQQSPADNQMATFDPAHTPVQQQPSGFDSSGKTDLDLEIERYQREIEEKQRHGRHSLPQEQVSPAAYSPPPQQPQQPPPPPPSRPPAPASQQDYDVYNMDSPSFEVSPQNVSQQPPMQQQPVQPAIGDNDDDAMFFTSVDRDRQKKPMKRPVNPRTQQQKGFLSKFFNKDMS